MFSHKELLGRIKKHRANIDDLKSTMGNPATVEVLDVTVTLADKCVLPITIYRANNLREDVSVYPTVFYIPGSGFTTLNPFFPFVTCSHLADKSGCQVIILNHRLAPEHPFPQGLLDACEVISILFYNAIALKIDRNKSVLAGECSGGNFAINIIKLLNREKIPIKHLFLVSPYVDFSESLRQPKYEEKDKCVSEHFLNAVKRYYIRGVKDLRHPFLSPYWHNDFKELPPTHILTGQYDRTRGNSFFFFKKLKQSEVPVFFVLFKKEDHGFLWHNIRLVEQIAKRSRDVLNIYSIPRPIIDKDNAIRRRARLSQQKIHRNKICSASLESDNKTETLTFMVK